MTKDVKVTLSKTTVNDDNRTKILLSHKNFVIQLLSSLPIRNLFDNLKEEDLIKCSKDFIMPMGNSRYSDVLYKTNDLDEMFLLIEAQSYQDYSMMWRIQEYTCGIHEKFFKEYYTTSTSFSEKRICARNFSQFSLPSIIPIVYYTGSEEWKIPTLLKMIFKLERIASKNNKLNLDAIKQYKLEYEESLNTLSAEEIEILNETIDLIGKRYNVNLLNAINIKEGVDNMSAIDEMFENARQDYIKQGLEQGKKIQKEKAVVKTRKNTLILLQKKFNTIPNDIVNIINNLSEDECNNIILNILDINSIEELRQQL